MNYKKYAIVLLTLSLIVYPSYSQHLYSIAELDTIHSFSNLSLAQKTPEKVIKLVLKGKKNETALNDIQQFENLQFLSIKRASISTIPTNIKHLKNLQVLDLGNNKINEIPLHLTLLYNLKILRLGQNEIKQIPSGIRNLDQLIILDLWSNELESIPSELKELKELRFLDLRVIQFNQEKQNTIRDLLPWVKIEFSYSCNCN